MNYLSMSSLKERGRVKRRVMQSFVPVFRPVAGMPGWPAGFPGAWRSLFPDSCRSLVSGPGGVKDRA